MPGRIIRNHEPNKRQTIFSGLTMQRFRRRGIGRKDEFKSSKIKAVFVSFGMEKVEAFLAVLASHWLCALFAVGFATGMRPGEILGL